MKTKILIIEDDTAILRGLQDNFLAEGYEVFTALDGLDGLESAFSNHPDLIVLDIMLPKVNGYEVCQRLRNLGSQVPIVMLTAKGEEDEVCLGLDVGADDYLTKPFSMKELLSRVKSILRRCDVSRDGIYEFFDFVFDNKSGRLTFRGETVELQPREVKLLAYFLKNTGRTLSRDFILKNVWGLGIFVNDRTVDRFVSTLRKKLENAGEVKGFIKTVRNVGYRFDLT